MRVKKLKKKRIEEVKSFDPIFGVSSADKDLPYCLVMHEVIECY